MWKAFESSIYSSSFQSNFSFLLVSFVAQFLLCHFFCSESHPDGCVPAKLLVLWSDWVFYWDDLKFVQHSKFVPLWECVFPWGHFSLSVSHCVFLNTFRFWEWFRLMIGNGLKFYRKLSAFVLFFWLVSYSVIAFFRIIFHDSYYFLNLESSLYAVSGQLLHPIICPSRVKFDQSQRGVFSYLHPDVESWSLEGKSWSTSILSSTGEKMTFGIKVNLPSFLCSNEWR